MIRIEKTDKHNRTLLVKGLQVEGESDPADLEITIGYTNDPRVNKAIALDHQVIPAIIEAVNERQPRSKEELVKEAAEALARTAMTDAECCTSHYEELLCLARKLAERMTVPELEGLAS